MELPDPITSLTATTQPEAIRFSIGLPAYLSAGSVVRLYEYTSSTPFASATMVAEFRGDTFVLLRQDTTTRYYWADVFDRSTRQVSVEYPTSAAGVAGVAALVASVDIAPDAVTTITSSTNAASLHLDITNPDDEYANVDFVTFTPSVTCQAIVRVSYQGQLVNSGGGSSSGISGEGMAYVAETSDVAGTLQAGQPISHTFDNGGIHVAGVFSLTGGVQYQAGLRLHVATSTSDAQIWARQLTITVEQIKR